MLKGASELIFKLRDFIEKDKFITLKNAIIYIVEEDGFDIAITNIDFHFELHKKDSREMEIRMEEKGLKFPKHVPQFWGEFPNAEKEDIIQLLGKNLGDDEEDPFELWSKWRRIVVCFVQELLEDINQGEILIDRDSRDSDPSDILINILSFYDWLDKRRNILKNKLKYSALNLDKLFQDIESMIGISSSIKKNIDTMVSAANEFGKGVRLVIMGFGYYNFLR